MAVSAPALLHVLLLVASADLPDFDPCFKDGGNEGPCEKAKVHHIGHAVNCAVCLATAGGSSAERGPLAVATGVDGT